MKVRIYPALVTLREITAETVIPVESLGFLPTGRMDGVEVVLELPLA